MTNTPSAQRLAREEELLRNLKSWATLHSFITEIADEQELYWLIRAEQEGGKRLRVLNRIYSRLNVLRKERELRQLADGEWPFGGINVDILRLRD
jgi:hypothetical protein